MAVIVLAGSRLVARQESQRATAHPNWDPLDKRWVKRRQAGGRQPTRTNYKAAAAAMTTTTTTTTAETRRDEDHYHRAAGRNACGYALVCWCGHSIRARLACQRA